VRVAPGRYVESAAWRGLRREERHAVRTAAAVGRMRDAVVGFASPLAGSAGESVYRVALDGLGFPAPRLQERHVDDEGLIGFTDPGWEAYGVYDEFDGFVKYLDREMRHGLTAEEIVVLEKVREDRLRGLPYVNRVTRTVWRDLARPQRIVTRLERAGLPRVHTANRARHRD